MNMFDIKLCAVWSIDVMKQEKEAFEIVPLYTCILALIFLCMETLSWKIPVILQVN